MSDRSVEVALRIAAQLCARQDTFSVRGLAGSAGASLLYFAAASASADERFRNAAHRTLALAARDSSPVPGLFTGIAGVYAAAVYGARTCDHRYGKLARQCETALQRFAERVQPPFAPAPATSVFDVVSGWSGTLLALSLGGASTLLDGPRSYLAWLADDAHGLRWRCVHPLHRDSLPRNDLGISHGIPGVLAALSFSATSSEPSRIAARTAAAFIVACASGDESPQWPSYVDANERPPSRTAWCYGTPGIASALYAAGRYLGDSSLTNTAIRAMRSAAALPLERWQMSDHALCHGTAGNALAFASLGQSENDAVLLDTARMLRDRLLAHYENTAVPLRGDHLEGDSGAALALLTLAGSCDSSWMLLYGLEPLRAAI